MPTAKKKLITVTDATLGMNLRVMFGGTFDDSLKEFRRWTNCGADDSQGDVYEAWTAGDMNVIFIWMNRIPKTAAENALFTHELTHAVTLFCEYTEIKCNEVYAKLVEYFQTQVMTKLKK
jgi:hypothetical protein